MDKICSHCKIEKDVSEFHRDCYQNSGLKSCCKSCRLNILKKRNNVFVQCTCGKLVQANYLSAHMQRPIHTYLLKTYPHNDAVLKSVEAINN